MFLGYIIVPFEKASKSILLAVVTIRQFFRLLQILASKVFLLTVILGFSFLYLLMLQGVALIFLCFQASENASHGSDDLVAAK